MVQAHGEQPWGEEGEEGMARSSPHCSWRSREVCGNRMGVRRWGDGGKNWREGWERGKNNRNSQYLLNSDTVLSTFVFNSNYK